MPFINSLNPTSGPVGTHVLVTGTGFTDGTLTSTVYFYDSARDFFNRIRATILSETSTSIIVVVPPGAFATGFVAAFLNDSGAFGSNFVAFNTTTALLPHITSLTPSNGGIGISVVVAGTNFGTTQGTSTVTFNGVVATVISWSATSITVTVPSLATTGPVVVTTNVGPSNGVTFTVTNPSNGGMGGPLNLLLIPAENFTQAVIWAFDTTNFNDASVESFYSWKVEDVIAGRTPTVSRVIMSFKDLGVATIAVTLSGTDQNTQLPINVSVPLTIGTPQATGALLTYLPGIELTAQNLQLSVQRQANAGPVCIVKVRLEGRVEMTAYA